MIKSRCLGSKSTILICCLITLSFSIIWLLIFLPHELEFTAAEASLTKSDKADHNDDALFYSLAINVSVRNPNKKLGIYVPRIQAFSRLQPKRIIKLSLVTLISTAPFQRGLRSTMVLPASIQGQQFSVLQEKDVKTNSRINYTNIEAKLALRVRLITHRTLKSSDFKPWKIDCELAEFPLTSSSNGKLSSIGVKVRATRCYVSYLIDSYFS